MIDICIVIHRNYSLLDLQLEHWEKLDPGYRLLFYDNTPAHERRPPPSSLENYYIAEKHYQFDGESVGYAQDFLTEKSKSDIICICDSDLFWLRRDVIKYVEELFNDGFGVVGCGAGGYPGWLTPAHPGHIAFNTLYPKLASTLCPPCFGMFIHRDLVGNESWVCTREEGSRRLPVGWRITKRVLEQQAKVFIFEGFKKNGRPREIYYEPLEKPTAVHFFRNSNAHQSWMPRHEMETILETYLM